MKMNHTIRPITDMGCTAWEVVDPSGVVVCLHFDPAEAARHARRLDAEAAQTSLFEDDITAQHKALMNKQRATQ